MPLRARTPESLPGVSIQPQARNVNQFYVPFTPPPAPSLMGAGLVDLANGLATISPVLDQMVGHQAEFQNNMLAKRAEGEALKWKNIADFQQAVKDGKVAESDNPWYIYQLQTEIIRNQATSAGRAEFMRALQDPLFSKDDTAAVEADSRSRLVDQFKDLPPDLAAAAAQEINKSTAQISNYHVQERTQARLKIRDDQYRNSVVFGTDQLTEVDRKSLAANADYVGNYGPLITDTQNIMDRNKLSMDPEKVDKATVESILSYGVRTGDMDGARKILDNLKSGDTPLSKSADVRPMIDHAEQEAIVSKSRKFNWEKEQQDRFQEVVKGLAKDDIVAQINAGKGVTEWKLNPALMSKLDGNEKFRLFADLAGLQTHENTLHNISKDRDGQRLRDKIAAELSAGKPYASVLHDNMEGLVRYDQSGEFQKIVNAIQDVDEHITAPLTGDELASITEKIYTGDLTIAELADLKNQKRISASDFKQWSSEVMKTDKRRPLSTEEVHRVLQTLDGQIPVEPKLYSFQAEDRTVQAARTEAWKQFTVWQWHNPTAGREDALKQLETIRDNVAKQFNGSPYDKFIKDSEQKSAEMAASNLADQKKEADRKAGKPAGEAKPTNSASQGATTAKASDFMKQLLPGINKPEDIGAVVAALSAKAAADGKPLTQAEQVAIARRQQELLKGKNAGTK